MRLLQPCRGGGGAGLRIGQRPLELWQRGVLRLVVGELAPARGDAVPSRSGFRGPLLQRAPPGIGLGEIPQRRRMRLLGGLVRLPGAGDFRGELGQRRFMPLFPGGDVFELRGEPRAGFIGIRAAVARAGGVAFQLSDLQVERIHRPRDPARLLFEPVAFDQQRPQCVRRLPFRLAQRRDRRRGVLAGRGRARDHAGDLDHRRLGERERVPGVRHRPGDGDPAPVEKRGLGAPDAIAQIPVAGGLARLALEPAMLLLERADDVFQPVEIGLRSAQPQLRLVAAGVQPGDAGGLFEHPAPLGRLGADQIADLSLVHDRRGAGAGRGVGEQGLHVARARLAAVDAELRAAAALDPARDVDLRPLVIGGRRVAFGVVEGQQHLGHVARRPAGSAREDHLVHLGGPHLPRRGLAHHPAQRLDDIGLAAAIGTDDPGEARIYVEIGRLDEGFEPGEAQA